MTKKPKTPSTLFSFPCGTPSLCVGRHHTHLGIRPDSSSVHSVPNSVTSAFHLCISLASVPSLPPACRLPPCLPNPRNHSQHGHGAPSNGPGAANVSSPAGAAPGGAPSPANTPGLVGLDLSLVSAHTPSHCKGSAPSLPREQDTACACAITCASVSARAGARARAEAPAPAPAPAPALAAHTRASPPVRFLQALVFLPPVPLLSTPLSVPHGQVQKPLALACCFSGFSGPCV